MANNLPFTVVVMRKDSNVSNLLGSLPAAIQFRSKLRDLLRRSGGKVLLQLGRYSPEIKNRWLNHGLIDGVILRPSAKGPGEEYWKNGCVPALRTGGLLVVIGRDRLSNDAEINTLSTRFGCSRKLEIYHPWLSRADSSLSSIQDAMERTAE